MKSTLVFAFTALLMATACSSEPKEASSEMPAATPALVATEPVPAEEVPPTNMQACGGKAAKDACSYTAATGEIKGVCVRTETQALLCMPKKSKKK